jgi:two-component system response regulator (stage 0 sporulation protein A)
MINKKFSEVVILLQKLLVVDRTEDFCYIMECVFGSEFDLRCCRDGRTALKELEEFRPDALILSLTLPYKDGFTVLEETTFLPPAILGITDFLNDYVSRRAMEVGIGYLLLMPSLETIRRQLHDLLQQAQNNARHRVANLLGELGIPAHRDGFRQLCVGVPLVAKDPHQRMIKELYPAIAEACGVNAQAVEHSIRSAVQDSWKDRDTEAWKRYFPEMDACPSNKVFITRLAMLLTENE